MAGPATGGGGRAPVQRGVAAELRLFRASDLTHALRLMTTLVTPWNFTPRSVSGNVYMHVTLLLFAIWLAPFCERYLQLFGSELNPLESPKRKVFYSATCGVAAGILFAFCLVFLRGKTTFIYFQF